MNAKRILAAAGAVLIAATLAACGPHRFSQEEASEHAEWFVQGLGRKLDLNDTQKAKLEVVKDKLIALRQQATANHANDRTEILAMLSQPTLDRGRAQALAQQHINALQSAAPDLINAFGDFYDSLTPAQQKAVHDRIEKQMSRHHP